VTGGLCWINGRLGGTLDPRDRGLTLGDGVFDTLVAFNRVPFAADLHLQRLRDQAHSIGIEVDTAAVQEGWHAVLRESSAARLILRTTVTRGPSGRALRPDSAAQPTLIVAGATWDPRVLGAPAKLATSAITRNPGSPSSRIKSLGYLDHVLAAREAAARGADDALMLTPSGAVACTTIANVFAISDGRLVTPPLSDAAQPGIMRHLVLQAAEPAGLSAEERRLEPADLLAADQLFLTNSVRFLCPCVWLDGTLLPQRGQDRMKPLLAAICGQVVEQCGTDPRLREAA
jgi:branched-chain amino acid aminotransferase